MYTVEQSVLALLDFFSLKEETVLKVKTKKFPGITAGSLFKAILLTNSIQEAAILLKCSSRTIQRCFRELFPPDSLRGGKQKQYLLQKINLKYCNNCNKIFSSELFHTGKSKCKICTAEVYKEYYINNKDDIINKVADRRALLISRIPIWANKEKIKQIYDSCPKNYHVDHIVPLQGNLVSGLHVENNLQYLPKEENLRKSNKWEVS